MAKRKSRATIKYEWKPGWKQVRERLMEPAFCARGEYRTTTLSKPKDVQGILCCPRGTTLAAGRGCRRDGEAAGSMKLQALRHGVGKFKFRHPDVWARLQAARPDSKGIRTVPGTASAEARKARVA